MRTGGLPNLGGAISGDVARNFLGLVPKTHDGSVENVGIFLGNLEGPNRRGHPKWWFSKGIPPKMALN